MRVVAYNPLAAARPDRIEEISQTFGAADIVLLYGTTQYRRKDEEVHSVDSELHHWWCWGRDGGSRSSKAAGCMIGLRKKSFRRQDVYKVYQGINDVRGRTGGLRIRNDKFDMTALVAYFPPRERGRAVAARYYEQTTGKMMEWIEDKVDGTPDRSMLVLGCDLNDTLNFEEGEDEDEMSEIGKYAGNKKSGKAAIKMKELMAKHRLFAVNTFWSKAGPTFYGNTEGATSNIDYLMMSKGMAPEIFDCRTLKREATKLQLIPDRRHRDHIPIKVDFKTTTRRWARQKGETSGK